MDRRHQAQTDESGYSIASSIKDLAITGLQLAKDYVLTPQELASTQPDKIL
jgi:hypothetical protein